MRLRIVTFVDGRVPFEELLCADLVLFLDCVTLIARLDHVVLVAILGSSWLGWGVRVATSGSSGTGSGAASGSSSVKSTLSTCISGSWMVSGLNFGLSLRLRGGGRLVRLDATQHTVVLASYEGRAVNARIETLELLDGHAPLSGEGVTRLGAVGSDMVGAVNAIKHDISSRQVSSQNETEEKFEMHDYQ